MRLQQLSVRCGRLQWWQDHGYCCCDENALEGLIGATNGSLAAFADEREAATESSFMYI
jgi:hypothetical protein